RETLGQGSKAGLGAVGAGLPVARDPQDDQPRVGGDELIGAEAPPLERTGPEVLYQHVRRGDQAAEDVGALRLAEIEGDRALVPGEGLPHQWDAIPLGSPTPLVVADLRLLDLDHIGAELS